MGSDIWAKRVVITPFIFLSGGDDPAALHQLQAQECRTPAVAGAHVQGELSSFFILTERRNPVPLRHGPHPQFFTFTPDSFFLFFSPREDFPFLSSMARIPNSSFSF
jgi:hypothetical protein|tara:strand:+ start:463 stop:783 length:321 start_codon:yes stop_codon:yes gene_type:complete